MIGGSLVAMARVMFAVDNGQLRTDMTEGERIVQGSTRRMASEISTNSRRSRTELDNIGRGAVAASGLLGGLSRSVAFASGAFLGGAGLAFAARAAFDELAQGEKATAQTNAVLKSTGGIAGVTADHIDKLAGKWLKLTGADDDAIHSMENVLLTFTSVRDVVGKGNDIFDQSVGAVLDMSTAMGEDLSSSAVRVGKALQDPILGVTALRRVGVAFTDDQVKLIKHLVETNHMLDAQKLILKELTREFGGSAEAAGRTRPGELSKAREELRNLAGEVATDFSPEIKKAVEWLEREEEQLSGNTEAHRKLKTAAKEAGGAIEDGIGILKTGVGVFQQFGRVVGGDKEALELVGEAFIGLKIAGWAKDFQLASGAAGGLLGNLRNLAKVGTITIGITTLINGLKTPGPKGFLEQLLGAGAVGWSLGGPGGAMVSITADVLYNVLKKPAANDPTNPTDADYTYTIGKYKGYGVAVKGAPGDTAIGTLLQRADQGKKLTAAQQRELLDYARSHLDDGTFLGFATFADALAFYKDSNVYNLVAHPKGTQPVAPRRGGGVTSGSAGGLTGDQKALVDTAFQLGPASGKVYSFGGTGDAAHDYGYDCSGYVQEVYRRNGVTVPRTSQGQFADPNAKHVSIDDLQPGDAVFFDNGSSNKQPDHVGFVVSGSGRNAVMIDYFHTGQKAELKKVVDKGLPFMGGRRWIKIKTSGAGADPPPTPHHAPPAASDLIPARLENAVKEAELAGNKGEELKALDAVQAYLQKLLSHTTNAKKRGDILDALITVKSEKASLKPKPEANPLIPYALQLRLDQAQASANKRKELTALEAIDDYLTKLIAKTKSVKKKEQLTSELASVRGQEQSIRDSFPQKNLAAIPGLQAVFTLFQNAAGGQMTTTATLPGIGRILIPFAPTVDDWKRVIDELSKKLKAANERKAALQRSLTAAQRAKHKNPTLIARLKKAVTAISQTIVELRSDIGDALVAVKDLNDTAASEAQQKADEAERLAAQNLSDAMGAAQHLPDNLDLELAQAEGTTGTDDDVAALRKAAAFYQSELDNGTVTTAAGTFALDTATKAAITRQLNQINQQILDIDKNAKQTATDIGVSFLTALRGLRQYQNTVLDPLASLAGSTIHVTNIFGSTPDDPLLYAKGIEFELKALVG